MFATETREEDKDPSADDRKSMPVYGGGLTAHERVCVFRWARQESADERLDTIKALQAAAYTMCGGGFVGQLAVLHPRAFYVDARVGKLPYPVKQISKVVETLCVYATVHGLDTDNLPVVSLPGCFVW